MLIEEKDIYAYFGLAFYWANCLEHEVVNSLACLELIPTRNNYSDSEKWSEEIDKHYDDSFSITLGKLISRLVNDSNFSQNIIIEDLKKILKERNFLAHHFYREYADHWISNKGREVMVKHLKTAINLFESTDKNLHSFMKPFMEKYGVTETKIAHESELMKKEFLKNSIFP